MEVVTGLNALEVKGLIASSYLCISSRFHGVASALNSCVPCLATSWSHKYEELFNDYNQPGCILDLDNVDTCVYKVVDFLENDFNYNVRNKLSAVLPSIKKETENMWKLVWSLSNVY